MNTFLHEVGKHYFEQWFQGWSLLMLILGALLYIIYRAIFVPKPYDEFELPDEVFQHIPTPPVIEKLKCFFVVQDIHAALYIKDFNFNEPDKEFYNWTHDFRRAQRIKTYDEALKYISDIKNSDIQNYNGASERFFNIIKLY